MRPTDATTALLEALSRRIVLDAGAPRAVGYSGGRDSATLLWGLAQLCPPEELTALHVDHGWRPAPEREAERLVVQQWCRALGVNLVTFAPPDKPVLNEADARRHRYHCFTQWTQANDRGVVYLAHHADDQAETILMRLLKGRSWDGLGGMPEQRGPYRRPLLSLGRDVLDRAALEQGIPWYEDSTNATGLASRNLLRNQVFPLLRERWPRVVGSLVDFGAVWRSLRPRQELDPAWVQEAGGAHVSVAVWDGWSPLQRQTQLLVLTRLRPGPVSRRFLEAVCADGRRGGARGQGWWWRRSTEVSWRTVAPAAPKEYFIVAEPGRWYNLGSVRWTWSLAGPAGLPVPAIDGQRPWVWRSASQGLRLGSVDETEWGRDRRKALLGGRAPAETALVIQDGFVRAVVDLAARRLVWAQASDDSDGEKLHKGGIFVTLVTVTRNLTE